MTPELQAAKKQFLTLAHKIVEAEVAEKLRPNDADFEEQFRSVSINSRRLLTILNIIDQDPQYM